MGEHTPFRPQDGSGYSSVSGKAWSEIDAEKAEKAALDAAIAAALKDQLANQTPEPVMDDPTTGNNQPWGNPTPSSPEDIAAGAVAGQGTGGSAAAPVYGNSNWNRVPQLETTPSNPAGPVQYDTSHLTGADAFANATAQARALRQGLVGGKDRG